METKWMGSQVRSMLFNILTEGESNWEKRYSAFRIRASGREKTAANRKPHPNPLPSRESKIKEGGF